MYCYQGTFTNDQPQKNKRYTKAHMKYETNIILLNSFHYLRKYGNGTLLEYFVHQAITSIPVQVLRDPFTQYPFQTHQTQWM